MTHVTISAIQSQLEDWLATAPNKSDVVKLQDSWNSIKNNFYPEYQALIDDRFAQVLTR